LVPRSFLAARSLVVCGAILGVCGMVSVPLTAGTPTRSARFSSVTWGDIQLGTIDPAVFGMALAAVDCAVQSAAIEDPSTLTIIDYSRPSTAKRLWVFDLRERALLYEELVAHGKGSGENLATRFSNEPDSNQSSLGLFLTQDAYIGKNGYSLRLRGLDEGFNDHAYDRAIVMHGADYVSDEFAHANGRLGRSWGCPALREGVARAIIDRVKGTGLLFAYYPNSEWLTASRYLGDCAAARTATR
jgi:L,D-transpeptidase-like protein